MRRNRRFAGKAGVTNRRGRSLSVERKSPMSLLIVNAASEDTIAAPGNRQPNYITVSVTDAAGVPTTGLTAADFNVDPMIVGPGGALVNITSVTAGRLPGFYLIDVLPIRTETWK